jgi:hypothetical protein
MEAEHSSTNLKYLLYLLLMMNIMEENIKKLYKTLRERQDP